MNQYSWERKTPLTEDDIVDQAARSQNVYQGPLVEEFSAHALMDREKYGSNRKAEPTPAPVWLVMVLGLAAIALLCGLIVGFWG